MKEILKTNKLSKHYGSVKALNPCDLTIQGGRILGLAGENGAGKSTLLKLLANVIAPTTGDAFVHGQKIGDKTHALVAFMPDSSCLFKYMRIKHIIDWYEDMFSDFSRDKAKKLCHTLQLNPKSKIANLSKGVQAQVQIMLTLSRQTMVYLFDEPLANIDPLMKHKIMSIFRGQVDDDCVLIISTHLLRDMENMLDEIIFIQNGFIKEQISTDEIREKYGLSTDEYYCEVMKK